MKYLLILVSLGSLFLLSSCGDDTPTPEIKTNNGKPVPVSYNTAGNPFPSGGGGSSSSAGGGGGGGESRPLEEDTFDVAVINGKGVLEFNIKSGSRALIKFSGEAGKVLTASLVSISGDVSGYRFSQILFPDGTSDGPFEKNITYSLFMSGKHGIRIAPDNGGNIAGGKMRVELVLQ